MGLRQTVFLSSFFLCCSLFSNAQLRFFAGPQMSTANYSIRNAKQPAEWKAGFLAGVGLTNQIEGPLYFSPSLYFNRIGYKVSFDRPSIPPGDVARNNNTSINTIVLAPLLQFNLSRQKSHFFVRFGPAVEVAVSGKETFDSATNKPVTRSMLFDPTGYSRTNFFANLHFGFEQKNGLGIYVQYEHGLSSLNNSDNGPIILNRAVGLALQWRFRRE